MSQTSSRNPRDVHAGTGTGDTGCFFKMRVRCVAYLLLLGPFLGSFVEFVKATLSFVMSCLSVRPCVRPSAWNKSAPTGRIFIKFDKSVFGENLLRKFIKI